MIRFLLIDVGYDCEELNEPLGIETLFSYLNIHSPLIETRIYSANFDNLEYSELLNEFMPDIIGISTHINTWDRLNGLYEICCKYYEATGKSPVFIIGGILATYEYKTLLNVYENIICSIGEGEESISTLLNIASEMDNIIFNKLIYEIISINCPNLAVRNRDEIVLTRRSYINDLVSINLHVEHKYIDKVIEKNGIVRMEASRGCPWNKCSFCVLPWKYAGAKWRPFSIEKIINEIILLSSKGANTIYFTDEEFLGGEVSRLWNLINKIKEAKRIKLIKPELEFVASTSVQALSGNYGIDARLIKRVLIEMKEVGFRSFFLGVESGCDSQLTRFNKGTSVKTIENVLKLLDEINIETDIGYILFDPLMHVYELKESLNFLKRNGLNEQMSRFAKRLRIVPFTPFCNFEGLKLGTYDSNLVEHNYKFSHTDIQNIYDKYSEWEEKHLSLTHSLQAEIRNLQSSKDRKDKIEILEKIRVDEYYTLNELVNIYQDSKVEKSDYEWRNDYV